MIVITKCMRGIIITKCTWGLFTSNYYGIVTLFK